jgi:hypothetical protein
MLRALLTRTSLPRRPRLADWLRRMTQAPCQHKAEQQPEQHHAGHE